MGNPNTLCIAGKNRIAVEALRLLDQLNLFDISVCPVQSDTGEDTWQPSLKQEAMRRNKPIITLAQAYKRYDLIFLSLEFDKIINVNKFENATLLNIHFSLLPACKGCDTSIWPIYFGERVTGVTLHAIDYGIDTGPLIDQETIELDERVTSRELYDLYQDSAVRVLQRNAQAILLRDFTVKPQEPGQSTYFPRGSLSRTSPEIDFSATASQISRHVRAFFFPEYQTATCNGAQIEQCTILGERSRAKPGTVLSKTSSRITISTVDFDVELVVFQP